MLGAGQSVTGKAGGLWVKQDAGLGVGAGAREGMGRGRDGAGSQAGCRGGWGLEVASGGPSTRGTHLKHAFHVVDTGRVEVQRLIKRLRVLRSRKDAGLGVSAGGERRHETG